MTNDLQAIRFGSGWHTEEKDDVFVFRWMGKEGDFSLEAGNRTGSRYLELSLFSEFQNASQRVSVSMVGTTVAELSLLQCWNHYSIALPSPVSGTLAVRLKLNKVFPRAHHPADARDLGLRMAAPRFHDDPDRHTRLERFHRNGLLNLQEAADGKTVLESYPMMLGVDLWGRCNIKPPCVYCFWDGSKDLEQKFTDALIDAGTFEGYGGFFESARMLQNCSIGEPFLHPQFGKIVDLVDSRGKLFELSTNGQMFTPRIIEALAGKKVYLYLSLDAATPETYARLRNEHWEAIPGQLKALAEVRQAHGGWPKVFMVFMPMKANLGDLEPFVRLCKDVEADALVLRPLLIIEHDIIRDRAGYHFDYRKEVLNEAEQRQVIDDAERLTAACGVRLLNQYYFGAAEPPREDAMEPPPPLAPGEELAAVGMPPCREPWQSYFILRRGVFPCCYGHLPIAPMDRWKEAWNSPVLQEIRAHLARGTFSLYCRRSITCPIIQRHVRKGEKEAAKVRRPAWLRALKAMDGAAYGIPGRVWRRLHGRF